MSLSGQINSLATRIGQEIKAVRAEMAAGRQTVATTSDYSSTSPASPSTGLVWFSRHRARRMPAVIGPQGFDITMQPHIAFNRPNRYVYTANAAAPQNEGLNSPVNYAAPTSVTVNSSSHYTSMVRTRYSTGTTAGTYGGLRTPAAQFMRSATPNTGGFHTVIRAGFAVLQNGSRAFVGMQAGTGGITNVEPSTLANVAGFALGASQTNWQFITNADTGTATESDTGFSARVTNVMYEFSIFVPPGNSTDVFWSIRRLSDNAVSQGAHTTQLPALDTFMVATVWHTNNTVAAAQSLEVGAFYVETDN